MCKGLRSKKDSEELPLVQNGRNIRNKGGKVRNETRKVSRDPTQESPKHYCKDFLRAEGLNIQVKSVTNLEVEWL